MSVHLGYGFGKKTLRGWIMDLSMKCSKVMKNSAFNAQGFKVVIVVVQEQ
jgi:hypothetical protein